MRSLAVIGAHLRWPMLVLAALLMGALAPLSAQTAPAQAADTESPATASKAAALVGRWTGSFTIGPDDHRQLVLTFSSEGESLQARVDLPAQGISGVAADSVQLEGNELTISISPLQAEFYGTLRWSEDGRQLERIDGDWSQVAEFVAITLYPDNNSQEDRQ